MVGGRRVGAAILKQNTHRQIAAGSNERAEKLPARRRQLAHQSAQEARLRKRGGNLPPHHRRASSAEQPERLINRRHLLAGDFRQDLKQRHRRFEQRGISLASMPKVFFVTSRRRWVARSAETSKRQRGPGLGPAATAKKPSPPDAIAQSRRKLAKAAVRAIGARGMDQQKLRVIDRAGGHQTVEIIVNHFWVVGMFAISIGQHSQLSSNLLPARTKSRSAGR